MKYCTYLLLFILLSMCGLAAHAQTEAETLEWLNVNKNDYYSIRNNFEHFDSKLQFTNTAVKSFFVSDDQQIQGVVEADWSKIKRVTFKDSEIFDEGVKAVVVEIDFDFNVKTSRSERIASIRIKFRDSTQGQKFQKALLHMAQLKGAKLIKDDLF